jgi:hypothetical protein
MRIFAKVDRKTVITASVLLLAAALLVAVIPLRATAPGAEKGFPSPEAAWKALIAAVEANDTAVLKEIFGPGSSDLISSGDPVADQNIRESFLQRAQEKMVLVALGKDRRVAHIGKEDWPFPVPIVKDSTGWHFDSAVGMEELINRRIGRNELDTLEVLRAAVEAQEQFAKMHKEPHYAQKIKSTEGTHDGLYWKAKEGEEESPLGPLAAEAIEEGYGVDMASEGPRPFHGYLFRILTAQGKAAPGGEKSYLDNEGKMTKGFAFLAWPANYGASGVMTFIVNRQGIVFQKDLGEATADKVKEIREYNPDDTWMPVAD